MSRIEVPFFQIDAFADGLFKGNPAAVVVLQKWLPDDVLLNIAKEHNQSETAFFIPCRDSTHDYELRWFTTQKEVDLCGHATLASASVIFNQLGHGSDVITFKTRKKGDLWVRKDGDLLELDFPADLPRRMKNPPTAALAALGIEAMPVRMLETERDYYFVYDDPRLVRNAKPDMKALSLADKWSCITAPGDEAGVDFISRFFTVGDGLDEDPVTGSTHCALAPYWGERLGKSEMTAKQVSERGGTLRLRLDGDRVMIAGKTQIYAKGTALVPNGCA